MKLAIDTQIKDDLGGVISLKFIPGTSLNDFCSAHIEHYDPERFEILAIRFYYGKEMIITIYAIDNACKDENDLFNVPVKKFKVKCFSIHDILPLIEEFNFTLTTGIHPLDEMNVYN